MQITAKQKLIFYLIIGLAALTLLIASLCFHLISIGNINLQETIPFVFLLHVGIFVLMVPILLLQKIEDKQEDEKIVTLQSGFEQAKLSAEDVTGDKSNAPKWLIAVYFLLGIYVAINFMIFGFGAGGNAEVVEGKYVLRNHGETVKKLSKSEYDVASAQSLRGFSGHWIIFYFYFTTVAFLQFKKEREK